MNVWTKLPTSLYVACYGNSRAIGYGTIHTVSVISHLADVTFQPRKDGTRFSDPEGMQG